MKAADIHIFSAKTSEIIILTWDPLCVQEKG